MIHRWQKLKIKSNENQIKIKLKIVNGLSLMVFKVFWHAVFIKHKEKNS